MKVKTILVSQPEPKVENSPYFNLIEKQKVRIDFRPFIHVEGVSGKEVRSQKVDLNQYSAIILTSRNSVDHFFRIADELRFKVPDTMKYFCQSEAVAFYLQKYVVYRKRKIYVGKRTFQELSPLIKKYKTERFLLPSSDKLKPQVPALLDELTVDWKQATFYKTVVSDLSDLRDVYYDILVFFSPSGILSLFQNSTWAEENKDIVIYVVYRKRKIYVGKRTFQELSPLIKKYKTERFLLPSSDKLKPQVPALLDELTVDWKQATFYKTVVSDLSDLRDVYYDILVFFSPSGILSLFQNFPDFEQNNTRIAVFGNTTVKAATEKGLRVDIQAPTPETPSMTMALEKYIKEVNGRR